MKGIATTPLEWADGLESSLLPDSGPLARIRILDNEIEAQVLHDVLATAGVPHNIQCYRDMAYDGLFQATRGWGAIIVREEDVEKSLKLIDDALADLLEK